MNSGEYILQIKIHHLWIHGDKMKNNTMNKYEQKMDGVAASAEVGEDNVVAVITDNRSTTRTTFEQRTGIDQNKLATMVWNIGMDSILNAAKHGMLQVLQEKQKLGMELIGLKLTI